MHEQEDHADGWCRQCAKRSNGKRKRTNWSVLSTGTLGSDTFSAPYALTRTLPSQPPIHDTATYTHLICVVSVQSPERCTVPAGVRNVQDDERSSTTSAICIVLLLIRETHSSQGTTIWSTIQIATQSLFPFWISPQLSKVAMPLRHFAIR
jgi:hypothetical protein